MSIYESALNVIMKDLGQLANGTAQNIVNNTKLSFDDICKLKGQHGAISFVGKMISEALEWISNNQDANTYPSTHLAEQVDEDENGNKKIVHVISLDSAASTSN